MYVQISYIRTLGFFVVRIMRSLFAFLVKYFIIELIDLTGLKDALFVPSLNVSGNRACTKTGEGERKKPSNKLGSL